MSDVLGGLEGDPSMERMRPWPTRGMTMLAISVALAGCAVSAEPSTQSSSRATVATTSSGHRTGAPAGRPSAIPSSTIGPNEAWIAYQAFGDDGRYGVQLIRPDGSGQRSPTSGIPGGDQLHPDWTPDGARLTFSVKVGDRQELWIASVDGSYARSVVSCEDACMWADEPAWSPDGNSIAFQRMAAIRGKVRSTLEIVDVRSHAIETVLTAPARHVIYAPRWSPNGKRIVIEYVELVDDRPDADFVGDTIGIVDLAGGTRRITTLLPGARFANNPDWSPVGDLLVFSAPAAGGEPGVDRSDLWTMTSDGRALRRVTDVATSGGHAIQPTFTPDGSRIIFALGDTSGDRMATIPIDGSEPEPATSSGWVDGVHPRLRPNS
jgi:Tol biopolymer transport system component